MQSSSLEAVVVDQVTLLTAVAAVDHQAEMLVTAALVVAVVDPKMVVDLLVTLVLTVAQALNLTVATVVALVLAVVERWRWRWRTMSQQFGWGGCYDPVCSRASLDLLRTHTPYGFDAVGIPLPDSLR